VLVPGDDPRGRDAFLHHLADAGVGARALWRPLHAQPPYAAVPLVGHDDVSGDLFRRGVSLPCATELTEADQERVVAAVRSFWA
jgi:dTDP-4-amino-4,6-dideoxygalactose transaminase